MLGRIVTVVNEGVVVAVDDDDVSAVPSTCAPSMLITVPLEVASGRPVTVARMVWLPAARPCTENSDCWSSRSAE